jgi:hypothetical protein
MSDPGVVRGVALASARACVRRASRPKRRASRVRASRACSVGTADEDDEDDEDGPSTASRATRVVRLDGGPSGAVVHLVGVSHVLAADAARDVRALVRRHAPDAVVVELCPERAPAALAAAVASSAPPGAAPEPTILPREVSILGLPTSRALPGASAPELLALLRARPGALVTPRRLARDRDTLLRLGIFDDVRVRVDAPDRDDAHCAEKNTGAIREVARDAVVTFRVTPDVSAEVTADVRLEYDGDEDPDAVERDVVRKAAEAVDRIDRGTERTETDDDDEAWDEAWEALALRAALGAAARATRDDARVEVRGGDPDRGEDEDVVYVSLTTLGGDDDEDEDEDDANGGTNTDRRDDSYRRRGLFERLLSSAGAVSSSSAGARAYLAASEIAQELVARRLGDRAGDDSSSAAGYETVAALTAAMVAGTPRVVLGDARVSETTNAVAAAVAAADARAPFAGARLAAATLVDAARLLARDPRALRRDVESALEDEPSLLDANRRGGRGSPSRAAAGIPEWLRDAVVETRDERMFRATWAAAGGDGNGDDAPALVRTDDVEDGDWSCYVAEGWGSRGEGGEGEKSSAANAAASGRARTVVAVFGAAHVDGIVARWNAATRGGGERSDER